MVGTRLSIRFAGVRFPPDPFRVSTMVEIVRDVEYTMVEIVRDVEYTQAYGVRFCLHIGTVAFMFGRATNGSGPRLELLTPRHWFRWSKGYKNGQ